MIDLNKMLKLKSLWLLLVDVHCFISVDRIIFSTWNILIYYLVTDDMLHSLNPHNNKVQVIRPQIDKNIFKKSISKALHSENPLYVGCQFNYTLKILSPSIVRKHFCKFRRTKMKQYQSLNVEKGRFWNACSTSI